MSTTDPTTQAPEVDPRLQEALDCYRARQLRQEHPEGSFDKQGRWYPSADETRPCCYAIRFPSRAYRYSLLTHCRSIEHVAALYDVDSKALRSLARRESVACREGGDGYYKAVALVDGKMLSIYDGKTEYRIGETVAQRPRQHHGGGIYVYPTLEQAMCPSLPRSAALADAHTVILRCRAEGSYCRYDNGKLAFARVTPLAIVAR